MDVARGVALLGIFLVNIESFAQPFGRFIVARPEAGGALTRACFYVEKVLCEGKFYPMFSMLFGMGLVLQMGSVERRGGRFVPLYLRRLGVLLLIGTLHALLAWYGDILAVYAVCGLLLLPFRKCSAKTLMWIGIGLMLLATLFFVPASAMQAMGREQGQVQTAPHEAPSGDAAPATTESGGSEAISRLAETSSFFALIKGYMDQRIQGGPEHPVYMELESRAYRDGPWLDAFLFRAMTWFWFLFFVVFCMGWHILGLFFLGAALLKFDLFGPGRSRLRARLLSIGLLVGLPGSALGVLLAAHDGGPLVAAAAGALQMICSPMVALAYICGAAMLCESGRLSGILRLFAATGRMALTNYLMQTLIATAIFYWWGLAQFDSWSRPQRATLVLCVFAGQCLLSLAWISVFRFGPMEYLWRSLTYLRLEPLLRRAAAVVP